MIAAVIVAGGKGTRLGNPHKALLADADGGVLLDRLVAELGAAGASPVMIAANDPVAFARPGIPVVADLRREVGPLAGIGAALVRLTQDHAADIPAALVVPGDLPRFSRNEAHALISAWQRSQRPQVAVTSDGMQALCAVVPLTALPMVQGYLDAGRRSVHGLWQELGAESVFFVDARVFANLNTTADVAAWRGELPQEPRG